MCIRCTHIKIHMYDRHTVPKNLYVITKNAHPFKAIWLECKSIRSDATVFEEIASEFSSEEIQQ